MAKTSMEDLSKIAGDVVVSVLAVQRFTIESAFDLLESFEKHGLLDFDAVSEWSEEVVQERMETAGFRRSEFFDKLFSKRIHQVAKGLRNDGLRRLLDLERAKDISGSPALSGGVLWAASERRVVGHSREAAQRAGA